MDTTFQDAKQLDDAVMLSYRLRDSAKLVTDLQADKHSGVDDGSVSVKVDAMEADLLTLSIQMKRRDSWTD